MRIHNRDKHSFLTFLFLYQGTPSHAHNNATMSGAAHEVLTMQDSARALWQTNAGSVSSDAGIARLNSDMNRFYSMDPPPAGIAMTLYSATREGLPTIAKIQLSEFGQQEGFREQGSKLDRDLAAHSKKHGSSGKIDVEIRFPKDFPHEPPQVFLRRPILLDFTGVR